MKRTKTTIWRNVIIKEFVISCKFQCLNCGDWVEMHWIADVETKRCPNCAVEHSVVVQGSITIKASRKL